jgi:putative endonuclease
MAPLHIGVTSNLIQRVWQHKEGLVDGLPSATGVHRLVWYEIHPTMDSAIAWEKAIKRWKREWKIAVIRSMNPTWRDLYEELS